MDSDMNVQNNFSTQVKVLQPRPVEIGKSNQDNSAVVAATVPGLQAKAAEKVQEPTSSAKSEDQEQQSAEQRKLLTDAAREVSDFLNAGQRGLDFSIDEKAGRTVVKVMDMKEEKVIRQIPTEEVLKLAEKVRELKKELSSKTGILFDSKA